MGRLDQLQQTPSGSTGRLSQLAESGTPSGRLAQLADSQTPQVLTSAPKPEEVGFLEESGESLAAFSRGEIKTKDVLREVPGATKQVLGSVVKTLAPGLTNFFKTTGSILGEGLAYAIDPTVREQYKAGNLDILPTISETTQADLAKDTIAAGIETAVYRAFPNVAKMKLLPRGGAGALEGVGFAISEGLANDKTPEEIIDSLPAYGVLGGATGVITPYLLPLLKAETKALPKQMKQMFKGLESEVKALTPTKSTGRLAQVAEEVAPTVDAPPAAVVDVPEVPATAVTPEAPVATKAVSEPVTSPLQKPVGTGDVQVSRLQARMADKLGKVSASEAEDLGLATYQKMVIPEQQRAASELVTAKGGVERAIDILEGRQQLPEGLLPESVYMALREHAAGTLDNSLAARLVSLNATRAGQSLRLLAEIDPLDPVGQLTQIAKARQQRLAQQLGKSTNADKARSLSVKETVKETKAIKDATDLAKLKLKDVESLLDDLLC